MPYHEDPTKTHPAVKDVAERLQALREIAEACDKAEWYNECLIATGLVQHLAELITSFAPHGTPEMALAETILNAGLEAQTDHG